MTSVSIPATATPRIKDDVVARAVGDEMVLLDLESGIYYTLNRVAAVVWRGIEQANTVEQLIQQVVERYEVDGDTATSDLHELLNELLANGLLVSS